MRVPKLLIKASMMFALWAAVLVDAHTDEPPSETLSPAGAVDDMTGVGGGGGGGDGGGSLCASCSMIREELKNLSLLSIKEQILNKLGLKQLPNMTGRVMPKVPSQLLEKYNLNPLGVSMQDMQGDQPRPGEVLQDMSPNNVDDDDFHAKTERIIIFAQPRDSKKNISTDGVVILPLIIGKSHRMSARERGSYEKSDVKIRHARKPELQFRIPEKVRQASHLISAHLWVYAERPVDNVTLRPLVKWDNNQSLVYGPQISPRVQIGGMEERSQHSETHEQGILGWFTVDVYDIVNEWFGPKEIKQGIIIAANDENGRPAIASDFRRNENVPFLELHTSEPVTKFRTKRNVGLNCDENSHERRCCRYPLTVDFEEFGWDWIIAPKKYEANYCSGECPYVFLQRYPHTHIVHLANRSGTTGPCCAPRKLSSISMLYFDSEFNIIYGLLPSMVVDRCGCS